MNKARMSAIIERAVSDVAIKVRDIQRSFAWENFSEYVLWRELASCILGSRIQFELARSATRYLDRTGLLRKLQSDRRYGTLKTLISRELQQPIFLPLKLDGLKRSYTFPSIRARQLCDTAQTIYGNNQSLKSLLNMGSDEYFTRKQLIEIGSGIGPKQASLFLRNIGYANNLAILDTHVLRFMDFVRIVKPRPSSISDLASYERTESKLRNYAKGVNHEMSCLDTAIWIVMRVFQKEFAT